ncbi:hypothetical protein FB45DRAFT_1061609 [Roridomyces roridus]|uniref:Uncharacterized protein n=1 Tax=Roridomyces roridus TaxID=1738132 RepID=A0AAD7FK94_9AGAR|nr:hypothetical protein FB45DRAFT_1061609 [Roridomyces roridus]
MALPVPPTLPLLASAASPLLPSRSSSFLAHLLPLQPHTLCLALCSRHKYLAMPYFCPRCNQPLAVQHETTTGRPFLLCTRVASHADGTRFWDYFEPGAPRALRAPIVTTKAVSARPPPQQQPDRCPSCLTRPRNKLCIARKCQKCCTRCVSGEECAVPAHAAGRAPTSSTTASFGVDTHLNARAPSTPSIRPRTRIPLFSPNVASSSTSRASSSSSSNTSSSSSRSPSSNPPFLPHLDTALTSSSTEFRQGLEINRAYVAALGHLTPQERAIRRAMEQADRQLAELIASAQDHDDEDEVEVICQTWADGEVEVIGGIKKVETGVKRAASKNEKAKAPATPPRKRARHAPPPPSPTQRVRYQPTSPILYISISP